MNERIDFTKILKENPIGVKVGKLTILREVEKSKHPNGRTSRRFECICDCGNKTYALLDNLKKYHSTTCGHCGRENREIEVVANQKFGRLTIIREVESKTDKSGRKVRYVECICECGKICKVRLHALRRGRVLSCGCLRTETTIKKFTKHGLSKRHPLYGIWKGMKERCVNKNHFAYKDYGGRGIEVCGQWLHDFGNFYTWCISNGWRKGLSIDRIDNNKGYNTDNCRFADIFTQARNKRSNIPITYKEKTWHSAAQFCSDMNIPYRRFYQRIKRGISVEKAVELQ